MRCREQVDAPLRLLWSIGSRAGTLADCGISRLFTLGRRCGKCPQLTFGGHKGQLVATPDASGILEKGHLATRLTPKQFHDQPLPNFRAA
jgi:hypothetical protein